MANVYVTQETPLDFSKAEEYGELVFLSVNRSDDFHNIVNSEHNKRLMAHLAHGLKEFNEEEDFIVVTGSPYVRAAVMWILGRKQVRKVKFLRWDNQQNTYIPLTLTY